MSTWYFKVASRLGLGFYFFFKVGVGGKAVLHYVDLHTRRLANTVAVVHLKHLVLAEAGGETAQRAHTHTHGHLLM